MGWLTDLIRERQAQQEASAEDPHDEQHEPGTRRGEQRECWKIDPVTKQPVDVSCDEPGAMEK